MRTRRELLSDVGRGMIAAGLGTSLASDLGFRTAWADDGTDRLTFGTYEPLVSFLRDTPPDKLIPKVVEKLKGGTDLKQLVTAAALTNARAFGGEDYIGFHTLMALIPALQMSEQEPDAAKKPLAVLKVLHRNASRLKEVGPEKETLKQLKPSKPAAATGETVREQVRKADAAGAEAAFALVCESRRPGDALNELMVAVDDATEVHRVVLVSRAANLINYVGAANAHTMLRQSVRYCVKAEANPNHAKNYAELRALLPKLLDRHNLLTPRAATRGKVDDAWVRKFADVVFASTPAQAAEAVALALDEGFPADAIGEALSLAANQLLLRDEGRIKAWASANKPEGSVHGDSIGVHSCDAIHAWRNLAAVGDRRTHVTSLVIAGYQVARDRTASAGFAKWEPYPRADHRDAVKGVAADVLLKELDTAIRDKDQVRSAALTARIGAERPDTAKDVFALFRGYAVSEDGALHAEKYFATATDEFARARSAFKWRQLVALARVTASAYGHAAPGHKEACEVLKG